MLQKIKNNNLIKSFFSSRNIGLYVVFIIALSVTWSSIKIIQKNYELEQNISKLEQEVSVQDQTNKNEKLKNEYYKTDAYLDLALRKYFGKALPGEKLIQVSADVSAKYTHPQVDPALKAPPVDTSPKFIQNIQDWIDFFLHKHAEQ